MAKLSLLPSSTAWMRVMLLMLEPSSSTRVCAAARS
jgi:hypothetical protein